MSKCELIETIQSNIGLAVEVVKAHENGADIPRDVVEAAAYAWLAEEC